MFWDFWQKIFSRCQNYIMRVQRTVLGCKNTRAYVHSKVVNYGDKKSTYIGIDFFSSVTLECKILEFFLLWHSSLTDSRQEAMN